MLDHIIERCIGAEKIRKIDEYGSTHVVYLKKGVEIINGSLKMLQEHFDVDVSVWRGNLRLGLEPHPGVISDAETLTEDEL